MTCLQFKFQTSTFVLCFMCFFNRLFPRWLLLVVLQCGSSRNLRSRTGEKANVCDLFTWFPYGLHVFFSGVCYNGGTCEWKRSIFKYHNSQIPPIRSCVHFKIHHQFWKLLAQSLEHPKTSTSCEASIPLCQWNESSNCLAKTTQTSQTMF